MSGPVSEFADGLAASLADAWRAGDRVTAEDVLSGLTDLDASVILRVVFEEVCLRREAGETDAVGHLAARFPLLADDLQRLAALDELLTDEPPTRLPEPGESLGEFRLISELGRGAAGRVYLAAQPSLGGRPVVLKVTRRLGTERLALARLQHAHVVPLFGAIDFPDQELYALCMPYLGGLTLGNALTRMAEVPPARRSGATLLAAIDATRSAVPLPARRPVRDFLTRVTYEQAVCWLGACLADGLQFAHDRGVLHLDVKPANVLLAADGTPMLLDFHLARGPVPAGSPPPDWLGGTPGYMPPEQEEAVDAVRRRIPVGAGVDARADVYALGALLFEALVGRPPDSGPIDRLVRRANPAVARSLADLVARCLHPLPAQRYPSPAAVAADLRAHLVDLPLSGVPNRSIVERWSKWRRRRPGALVRASGLTAATLALLTVAGAAGVTWERGRREAETDRADAVACLMSGRYEDAGRAAARGRSRLADLPFLADLDAVLAETQATAARGMAAERLHVAANRARFLAEVSAIPAASAGITRLFEETATDREIVMAGTPTLEAVAEARIRDDLAELAGDPLPVRGVAWREWASTGRERMRAGDAVGATAAFERSVALSPGEFWPNFHLGHCRHRLGRHPDALVSFHACVVLAPESPECWFNRGLTLAALNRSDEALADYTQALTLDNRLTAAFLNRGRLHYDASRYEAALADFTAALEAGGPSIAANYNLALAYRKLGRTDEARRRARDASTLDPHAEGIAELLRELGG